MFKVPGHFHWNFSFVKTSHFFQGHFSSPVLQNVSHLKLNEFLLVQPSNSIILSVSISHSVIYNRNRGENNAVVVNII